MAVKEYEVKIKLLRNDKPCHHGHKIGDEWKYNYTQPAGMCSFAFNSLQPFLMIMKTGGTLPWQDDPDLLTIACPDPEIHNVFEIRRKLKK
jgi:uncharacterized repeat protein (TIGR04076 family)